MASQTRSIHFISLKMAKLIIVITEMASPERPAGADYRSSGSQVCLPVGVVPGRPRHEVVLVHL